ncbi:MAG: AraC family transcriptional regulator [Clostridiales bacterium]|jgi:AraC-like DNA-binding protein|nr:AraC family transcriptional regulator [Clostridiales bacterium]MDR2750252.1 AraC family transcriptional regulator [Clostridiales bacterium]
MSELFTEYPDTFYRNVYEDRDRLFTHVPLSLGRLLITAIMAGDSDKALYMLERVENRRSKLELSNEPLRSAKNSLICFVSILTCVVVSSGVDTNEAFALSDSIILQIDSFSDVETVANYDRKAVLQFIDLVNASRLAVFSPPVGRAVHYIECHLQKRLSLAEIASFVKLNKNYLCEIFKREVGESVLNYINRRKVQESTYFVRKHTYRLLDIALLYNFSSQSHFSAVFKRYIGTTPTAMREASQNVDIMAGANAIINEVASDPVKAVTLKCDNDL